jgi:hypothetical protein
MDLKQVGGSGMNSSGSERGQVAGSCEDSTNSYSDLKG